MRIYSPAMTKDVVGYRRSSGNLNLNNVENIKSPSGLGKRNLNIGFMGYIDCNSETKDRLPESQINVLKNILKKTLEKCSVNKNDIPVIVSHFYSNLMNPAEEELKTLEPKLKQQQKLTGGKMFTSKQVERLATAFTAENNDLLEHLINDFEERVLPYGSEQPFEIVNRFNAENVVKIMEYAKSQPEFCTLIVTKSGANGSWGNDESKIIEMIDLHEKGLVTDKGSPTLKSIVYKVLKSVNRSDEEALERVNSAGFDTLKKISQFSNSIKMAMLKARGEDKARVFDQDGYLKFLNFALSNDENFSIASELWKNSENFSNNTGSELVTMIEQIDYK